MTWTYTATSSGFTLQLNKVRREIGDVLTTDQLLSDEEIAYAGTVEGSDVATAARCCEWIAAYFGRKADMTEGKLSIRLSQRREAYEMKARLLRALDASGAQVFVGGESVSDKEANDEDTDRVPPAFWRGMLNNPSATEPTPEGVETNDEQSEP